MNFQRVLLLVTALVAMPLAPVSPQTLSSDGGSTNGESCECGHLPEILYRIGEAETARTAYDRLSKEDWAQQKFSIALMRRLNGEVQAELDGYALAHAFTHLSGGAVAQTRDIPLVTDACEVTYSADFAKVSPCVRTAYDLHEKVHVAACWKWRAEHPWDLRHNWNVNPDRTVAQYAQEDVAAYSAQLAFLRAVKTKLEKKCLGAIRFKVTVRDNDPTFKLDTSPDAVIQLSFADDDTFHGEGSYQTKEEWRFDVSVRGFHEICSESGAVEGMTLHVSGDVNDQRMHASIVKIAGIVTSTATVTCEGQLGTHSDTTTVRPMEKEEIMDFDLNPEPLATATRSFPSAGNGVTATVTVTIVGDSEPSAP
jgi:hypothetical protein